MARCVDDDQILLKFIEKRRRLIAAFFRRSDDDFASLSLELDEGKNHVLVYQVVSQQDKKETCDVHGWIDDVMFILIHECPNTRNHGLTETNCDHASK